MADLTELLRPGYAEILQDAGKIALAIVLGGAMGVEREIHARSAGLRTHIMVCMGSAMFIMAALHLKQVPGDITRVVQGVTTGVGFLGAGTIIKLTDKMEVKGLTTASSIWLVSAMGTAIGLGAYSLAVITAIASLGVLALMRPLDSFLDRRSKIEK